MTAYKDELVRLLSTPENLASVLEIESVVPEVKRKLQTRFWQVSEEQLLDKLKRDGFASKWSTKSVGDFERKPMDQETGLICSLTKARSVENSLGVAIFNYQGLYFGPYFEMGRPKENLPEIDDFSAVLRDDGFSLPKNASRKNDDFLYWVGWKPLDIQMNDNQFFLSMSSDERLFADLAIGHVLAFLHDHGDAIEKINKVIAAS